MDISELCQLESEGKIQRTRNFRIDEVPPIGAHKDPIYLGQADRQEKLRQHAERIRQHG